MVNIKKNNNRTNSLFWMHLRPLEKYFQGTTITLQMKLLL